MNKFALIAAMSVFSMFTTGCGPTTYSCDWAVSGTRFCTDYTAGFNLTTVSGACTVLGGTSPATCVKTGSGGGCRVTSEGVTSTTWYYGTVDEAKAACGTQTGGTFVAN